MKSHSNKLYVFIGLLALGAFQSIYYLPKLPETVASHFNFSGHPDGWTSKNLFVWINLGAFVVVAAVILGLSYFLPKMKDSTMNMPNKEYWLAPERRDVTLSHLTNRILWFGSATLLFLIGVMHLIFRVNLGQSDRLEWPFFVISVTYLVITVAWAIQLLYRFKRIPQQPGRELT